jgi:hypothetical protein
MPRSSHPQRGFLAALTIEQGPHPEWGNIATHRLSGTMVPRTRGSEHERCSLGRQAPAPRGAPNNSQARQGLVAQTSELTSKPRERRQTLDALPPLSRLIPNCRVDRSRP